MAMKMGLTRAGLGDVGSDERLIELAAAFGFETVDIDAAAFVARHGAEGAREFLARHGVALGSVGLPVEWRASEEQFVRDLEKLHAVAAAASVLGGTRCCTYILPSTDLPPAAFMASAVRRLRLCADILGAYGIRLGLEYVGPHHLRTRWAHPFIWTQADTLEMIAAIQRPNVGLLLDSFHWYTNGLTEKDLSSLPASQIVHVHLNDAPDVPVEEALDNGRLLPGEGVIDLVAFLRGIAATGYDGPVAQEVLTPSPPAEPPEAILERSAAGYRRLFAAAGLR
mgnify:CR=1 FL=1